MPTSTAHLTNNNNANNAAVQFLTIRNVANKRWSTARASVRMMSGVHNWDVRIERCISKNIFLGVATKEARLDNYVGCDRFGWAFLANRALWHNKGKVRGYGELFRSGDTVSILLDLDRGTLSFSLNGRSLGVAVEGLVGPLYPAFSLYNEDDSITVRHVRSFGEGGASLDHGTGACATEKLLHRLAAVDDIMSYILAGHRLTNATATATAATTAQATAVAAEEVRLLNEARSHATDELVDELHARWQLWRGGTAPVHAAQRKVKAAQEGVLCVQQPVVVPHRDLVCVRECVRACVSVIFGDI
jgi:hypothetical protein